MLVVDKKAGMIEDFGLIGKIINLRIFKKR